MLLLNNNGGIIGAFFAIIESLNYGPIKSSLWTNMFC